MDAMQESGMFGIGWVGRPIMGEIGQQREDCGVSTDCSLSGVSGPQLVEEHHRTRVTLEEHASNRVVTSCHCESA